MSHPPLWAEIVPGTELPGVADPIDYQRVVMNAGSTWDYFPGHYDPEYAAAQGHPAIFVNTMHIAGFIDRVATSWAGPCSRVVRRRMTLLGSIYAGDSMVARAGWWASGTAGWSTSRSACPTSAANCVVPPR